MSKTPDDVTGAGSLRNAGPGPFSVMVFIVSAVIIFGTILTGYALLRISDPGAFTWAPKLLDRRLGLVGAVSLLVSCVAAAATLRFVWDARMGRARALLAVSSIASLATLSLRLVELPSTSVRAGLAPTRSASAPKASHGAPAAAVTHVGDASQGKRIFLGTCAACHAPDGTGVKGQGQNLRDSQFLKDQSDERALAFVKAGRQPFDPDSKLHLAMPARGGNPALTDANLLDAIAYVRELQKLAAAAAAALPQAAKASSSLPSAPSADQPQVIDGELWLPHSILPPAQVGPVGTLRAVIALQQPLAEGRTAENGRRFFSIVLLANGLHTVYVLFGIILAAWLFLSKAGRGVSGISLASAAVYWVVISAIGLLLIPCFYL